LAVDVEDTGGNLSAGRNRLVARCKTPFVLILEDDFEAIPTSNLDSLCDVLNADEQLGLVCGSLIEGGRITAHAKDTRLFRGVLEATSPPADPWRLTVSGVRWRFCDAAANFLLARREVLVENPWDERLELMEHAPWFWTLKDRGLWKVGYTEDACLIHYRDRPTGEYTSHRSRTAPFTELVRTEYGFSRVVDVSRQPPEPTDNRPNVIIFGAGHQGTRLYMQVLEQLGWDIGGENLKRRVMENQRFVEINKAMLRERGVCDCGGLATVLADECDCARCGKTFCRAPTDDDPAGFFASLVDPWAIKDPRFVLTCSDSRWRAELDRVRPVFVLAERDIDQTRATYRRHGWDSGVIFGYAIKELRAIARREFEAWPHQKLAISFEQLTAAAKQVEWDRD